MKANSNSAVSTVLGVLAAMLFTFASCSKDNIVPAGEHSAKPVTATQLFDGSGISPAGEHDTKPVKATLLTDDAAKGSAIIPTGEHRIKPPKNTYPLDTLAKEIGIIPDGVKRTFPVNNTYLIDDAAKGIVVSPNPTTGPITVQFTESLAENYTIQVLNTQKAPLMSVSGMSVAGVNNVRLNLTSLGKGNYFVSFHSSNLNQTVEVSVQYP